MKSNSLFADLRTLTDDEATTVAGGSDTRGVNELINPGDIERIEPDGSWIQSNGYMMADYNGDGVYDQAWYAENGQWRESSDGVTWRPSNGPVDEWLRWGEEKN